MARSDKIVISGARAHNLKGIDLELPRDALIVITGLSGSGKSSLAFDTLYAEGQRRYVESLSSYARQFLGLMEKPDVDSIEGLSPAISIDQKTTSRNPRSTVGTVTEIYDYLRLLWARIGHPHCFNCGEPIQGQSLEQITDRVLAQEEGTRFLVLAPVVRGRKGEYGRLLADMRSQGYARAVVDGELRRLDEEIELDKKYKHDISIVVDRLVMKEGVRKRLSESIEAASQLADGLIEIEDADSGERQIFSERFACLNCGASMPEIEPRIFSFNSPHGACERCHGLGFQRVIDPELIVPDPTLSISEGALDPWTKAASMYHRRLLEAVAESSGIDIDVPWQDLSQAERDLLLEGTGDERHTVTYKNRFGRRRTYTVRFPGMLQSLERRYETTDSDNTRERVEELMAMQPCPACKGARLRPESLAVTIGGLNIAEFTRFSAKAALEWVRQLDLNETERAIAHLVLREVAERLRFLDSVGIGYLSLERAAATLSGGEAQRIRLATQIGSSLVGVMYILDEPSIGLHQRDNEKLLDTLARLRDLGNTVIVVEHDEGTMRAADHLVDLGPGAGEHGGEVIAEGTPSQVQAVPASADRPVPGGPALDRRPRAEAPPGWGASGPGRAPAQPEGGRRCVPAGRPLLCHRRLGLGQVHPCQRDPLPGGRQPPPSSPAAARRPRGDRRDRPGGQDHQHRPVADRPHPALEPGDLYRDLRPRPRPVLEDEGGAGARLQARPVLVQRQGRSLRGLPRRRADQDRDALPPRRLRALRAVPRPPLQPRDAGGPLQGQVHRRRA